MQEYDIIVVRRLSGGGGAVYHDLGNLNFSFIAPNSPDNFHNFRKFTQPVVDVLNNMGVAAELSGRNDIVVEGKRSLAMPSMFPALAWSAMAPCFGIQISVGSGNALRVKPSKFESKGIQSVRSRVANITEFLPANPPNIMEFRQMIINGVFGDSKVEEYRLTEEDWQNIHQLSQERYHNWEWNYGKSPAFAIKRETRYVGGTIEAWIDIGRGAGSLKISAFMATFSVNVMLLSLKTHLKTPPYEPQALRQVLSEININDYFVNITLDDLLYLLY